MNNSIIDSHTHVCGPPFNDDVFHVTAADGRTFDLPFKRRDCSVSRLLDDMNTHSIERAVVVAFEGIVTNEELSQIVAEHSSRLVGFAYLGDPLNADNATNMLERAVTELGLRGLKLLPGIQGFRPDDPRLVPVIQKAADLKIPVFIHTHPWPRGSFDMHKPEHIFTLKKAVPNAIIMVGHMAYHRFADLLAIPYIPKTYVETSHGLNLIAELHGIETAEKIVRRIGIDNIVFGSDWEGNADRMTETLDIIDRMKLSVEEKARIVKHNFEGILAECGR